MNWEDNYSTIIERINSWQRDQIDFFFALDFEKFKGIAIPIQEMNQSEFQYSINTLPNLKSSPKVKLSSDPISAALYKSKFENVHKAILQGDSYLCNLTCRTPIQINLNLAQIFHYATAPFKFLYKNKFTVFSPERFVKIENNRITTNPMKGTILAELKDAEKILLANRKETYEHNTIVDLLRNDLSIVASQVRVQKFQYLEKIRTHNKDLIQMSSEISGQLKSQFLNEYGTLLDQLLPAGSICGAPKSKTCEIIKNTEDGPRNYYTGIFGEFKNHTLDCAVAIRFIEEENHQMYFRSGGGITSLSHAKDEYEEMLNKIYVPIF